MVYKNAIVTFLVKKVSKGKIHISLRVDNGATGYDSEMKLTPKELLEEIDKFSDDNIIVSNEPLILEVSFYSKEERKAYTIKRTLTVEEILEVYV